MIEKFKKVENIIKSNHKYELVKIDKVYENFKSTRIEIRDRVGIYNRGLAGIDLDKAIDIFEKQYN